MTVWAGNSPVVDSGGCGHELSGFLKGEECLSSPVCVELIVITCLSAQLPCHFGTHGTAYCRFGRRAGQGPYCYDLMVFSWSVRKPLRIYFATT